MNSIDNHVLVEVSIDGNDKVSFNTNFGWVSKMSITVDATDLEEAVGSAKDFIKSGDPVPFENMCDNEEYIDEACESIKSILQEIECIQSLTGKREITAVWPATIKVKFTPSYDVNFGK